MTALPYAPLLAALLKGTVVIAIAVLAARLLARRVSAAWRHGIVVASLAAFVCVVATSVVAPDVRWRVLPRFDDTTVPAAWTDVRPSPTSEVGVVEDENASYGREAKVSLFTPATAFKLVWLAGSVVLLGRMFGIVIVTAQRRRTAALITTPSWVNLLQECRTTLGGSRSVELLLAEDVSSPFLWGAFRPAIVLPSSAEAWAASRRRMVLLHELAHLNRRDVEVAFAVQTLVALFWWNPVLWFAARDVEELREMAADDAALNAGVSPGAYVSEIVELVRYSRRAALYPAFSEGGLSRFERRMTRALSGGASRGAIPRQGTAVLAACAVLAGCSVATVAARHSAIALGRTGCAYDGGRHLDVGRKLPDGRPVWRVEWSGRGCEVRAEFIGAATYDAMAQRIVLPGLADTFRIRMAHGAQSDSVVVTAGTGAHGYSIASSSPADVDMVQVVVELEQHTGFGAPVRVPALLRAGGYAVVLAEARSMQVDHAVGRYLTEALRAQEPTQDEITRVLVLAAERVTNEHQLVALLQAAAPRRALANPAAQASYMAAAEALGTSAGRRAALSALESHHPKTP